MDWESAATVATGGDTVFDGQIDDALFDLIWNDLEGEVERERIRRAIVEAEAKYQHARVKTYVPVLMRRDILQILRREMIETGKPGD